VINQLNSTYQFILGSGSPRRKDLLEQLGLRFEVRISNFEEIVDPSMPASEVPIHFAEMKAEDLRPTLQENEIIMTADTDVILENKILGKPGNVEEAREMLQSLSGKWHEVTTGMCLLSARNKITFSETTEVQFKKLSKSEIDYYATHFQPFDKAGAYGIQEWIGLVGVNGIRGCFFNVIGLPVPRLWSELKAMVNDQLLMVND
jgi:septum formation protein